MRTNTVRLAISALLALPTISAVADQQTIYPPSNMPRVDMHTHMDAIDQYERCVKAMDGWGGTLTISLAGLFWVKDNHGNPASPASVLQIPGNDMVYVQQHLQNRILFVPGAFTIPHDGIWWRVEEIKKFKQQGFVGLKVWPHGAILSSKIPGIHEQLEEAGRQGMPLIAYHTGDPGDAKGDSPAFPKFEDDTVQVAQQHPQTTFIFAHGLFMLESDRGMEKLAGIFDRNPNIFVDVAFTHNMRRPAEYTVSKARAFYIKYKDRILFGSDVFAADAGAQAFLNERKLLETNQVTSALHGGPRLKGLNLPNDVLNHIYFWNAARLIPQVRERLEASNFKIGFELGRFKFDRLPPELSVNRLTITQGSGAKLTGTVACVTTRLTVKIGDGVYPAHDNRNGSWQVASNRLSTLKPGEYDVTVTATNASGLVRTVTVPHGVVVQTRK